MYFVIFFGESISNSHRVIIKHFKTSCELYVLCDVKELCGHENVRHNCNL